MWLSSLINPINASAVIGWWWSAKTLVSRKGEKVLFEDIKYLFYITNHTDYPTEEIVALANGRCDQENVIEQLKNGVNAMRMPVDDLRSNWAYMVAAAWLGILRAGMDCSCPTGSGV